MSTPMPRTALLMHKVLEQAAVAAAEVEHARSGLDPLDDRHEVRPVADLRDRRHHRSPALSPELAPEGRVEERAHDPSLGLDLEQEGVVAVGRLDVDVGDVLAARSSASTISRDW